MKLRQIEIDFDIHKMIEMERRDFDEPPNAALRRLLRLPDHPTEKADTTESLLDVAALKAGRPFVEGGVSVPHGSKARMTYQRGQQVYEGQFLDGKLVVNGVQYSALSPAAKALAITKNGTSPKELNGWLYWEVKFPGEIAWRKMDDLRKQFVKNLKLDIEV